MSSMRMLDSPVIAVERGELAAKAGPKDVRDVPVYSINRISPLYLMR
jgi:hypothetical protein